MIKLPYRLQPDDPKAPPMGLVVLQTDETIEQELASYFSDLPNPLFVTRIPSSPEVSSTGLAAMEADLAAAAALLPTARPYPVVGYGCTSASSIIGSDRVEKVVQSTCNTAHVTNPLRAAIACARHLQVSSLALLSPYVEEVNQPLRTAFAAAGLSTDVFGSFAEATEAKVVRIAHHSIVEAAVKLGQNPQVEAIFVSCTNLRTRLAIPEIESRIQKPVLTSNQALAWHMRQICGDK